MWLLSLTKKRNRLFEITTIESRFRFFETPFFRYVIIGW